MQGTFQLTETLSIGAVGGIRQVNSSIRNNGLTQTEEQRVWIASGNIQKHFETMVVNARFTRDINPSGLGLLVQTDRFQLRINKTLSETVTAYMAGNIYWVTSIETQGKCSPSFKSTVLEYRGWNELADDGVVVS